jgi:hypothetical protein
MQADEVTRQDEQDLTVIDTFYENLNLHKCKKRVKLFTMIQTDIHPFSRDDIAEPATDMVQSRGDKKDVSCKFLRWDATLIHSHVSHQDPDRAAY